MSLTYVEVDTDPKVIPAQDSADPSATPLSHQKVAQSSHHQHKKHDVILPDVLCNHEEVREKDKLQVSARTQTIVWELIALERD